MGGMEFERYIEVFDVYLLDKDLLKFKNIPSSDVYVRNDDTMNRVGNTCLFEYDQRPGRYHSNYVEENYIIPHPHGPVVKTPRTRGWFSRKIKKATLFDRGTKIFYYCPDYKKNYVIEETEEDTIEINKIFGIDKENRKYLRLIDSFVEYDDIKEQKYIIGVLNRLDEFLELVIMK